MQSPVAVLRLIRVVRTDAGFTKPLEVHLWVCPPVLCSERRHARYRGIDTVWE